MQRDKPSGGGRGTLPGEPFTLPPLNPAALAAAGLPRPTPHLPGSFDPAAYR